MGIIDGGGVARLGLAVTFGFSLVLLAIEAARFDRPSMAVAPGILGVLASPVVMAYVGTHGGDPGWLMTALPTMLLGGGAFFAAMAAQVAAIFGVKQVERRAPVVAAGVAGAAAPAAAFLQEVDDTHGGRVEPSFTAADLPPEPIEVDDAPVPEFGAGIEEISEEPTPANLHAMGAAPLAAEKPTYSPAEAISSNWGRGAPEMVQPAAIGSDEYVWDMMASQEVRMGPDIAALFAVDDLRMATPDVLRDAVAPDSLDDFDEAILGGSQPETGRFDVELATVKGDRVRLQGRRQVDHEGILVRLEVSAQHEGHAPVGAAAAAAPLTAAAPPMMTRSRKRRERQAAENPLAALETGAIVPFFQPIVRLSDRKIIGFEALARWILPDGSARDAESFVGQIIQHGRGLELAQQVIDRAAAELAAWIEAEGTQGQFVSINIAAADLPNQGLSKIIRSAVREHQLPPGALVVELTEDKIQASQSKAMQAAKAVRDAGASLAIDDFGVGYSTLNRLAQFRFDLVKVDRSIVTTISAQKKQRSLFKAILQTAKKSGAPVIAEGVEDEETAELLTELGCEFGQGFLFGGAEPVDGGAQQPASSGPDGQQQSETAQFHQAEAPTGPLGGAGPTNRRSKVGDLR